MSYISNANQLLVPLISTLPQFSYFLCSVPSEGNVLAVAAGRPPLGTTAACGGGAGFCCW
uniref:Uncharacterized protein n=1 Tax=Arundo donax TaxID=35708 RepID=A0A0A9AJE3_ARUDO